MKESFFLTFGTQRVHVTNEGARSFNDQSQEARDAVVSVIEKAMCEGENEGWIPYGNFENSLAWRMMRSPFSDLIASMKVAVKRCADQCIEAGEGGIELHEVHYPEEFRTEYDRFNASLILRILAAFGTSEEQDEVMRLVNHVGRMKYWVKVLINISSATIKDGNIIAYKQNKVTFCHYFLPVSLDTIKSEYMEYMKSI